MGTTTVGGVTAGVIDGASSIMQHLQELQKNPNDSEAMSQVMADFSNTTAAATALVPGLGATTAFYALTADFNLVIQKLQKGELPSLGDILAIGGNLTTIVGQVVEAVGVAATPLTGGVSLPIGLTVGEGLDALGAGISLFSLGLDHSDVTKTLGQIADAVESVAASTPTTNIPQVIVTGDRVTTIGSSLSGDGQTLTEYLSDQTTRATTVSPDGTTVTKVFTDSNGQVMETFVQTYTDSSRSTLASTVESNPDSATNTTETTTTNFTPDGNPSTFNTQIIDNSNPSAATGSATGTLNQDGSVSSATVSGVGVDVNSNNADLNVNAGGQVDSSGMGNSISADQGSTVTLEANSDPTINGTECTLNVNGDNAAPTVEDGYVETVINGNSDTVNTYGQDDETKIYGTDSDVTNYGFGAVNDVYGADANIVNNGDCEATAVYTAEADDTLSISNAYDTDTLSDDYSGYSAGYWGYYGYYYGGIGSQVNETGSAKGADIGALVEFDKAHGDNAGANQAAMAWKQIAQAMANKSSVVTVGAKWNHETVTWSLARNGGQFSGSMGSEEEQAIQKALDQWSIATGLKFQEVSPSAQSDIKFGWGNFDTAESDVVGLTGIRKKAGAITSATVRLENPSDDPLVTDANGNQVYAGTDSTLDQVLLHEIGHALGFGDNVDPTSIENYSLSQANRTLSASDIAAAASLYGRGATKARLPQFSGRGADGLVQAMSAFAPGEMAIDTLAANDLRSAHGPIVSSPLKYAAR